jgi:hypothetical protein
MLSVYTVFAMDPLLGRFEGVVHIARLGPLLLQYWSLHAKQTFLLIKKYLIG